LETFEPGKNLSKSEKDQPELPGLQRAPEVTDPALAAAAAYSQTPYLGRHVMAASKNPTNGKPKKTRKKSSEAKAKKLSALDAAAQVLADTGQPMACKEMIETMAAKGYWSSPSGKTPSSTLYSAILKEIANKGKESRFKKTDRGRFART